MDDAPNIAIFCDYENIAIGAREAKFDRFNITIALERLLDKGKVVFKKAYADWDRFKQHKRGMHEAGFELVEIPHVSYSGKNSADIRLVVDALDLCYTKSHVDTFAILSGDSDFSPLVSKLRENNKKVIGIGVKHTSSDLLIENCDDFIYYDDLVRKHSGQKKKTGSRRSNRPKKDESKEKPEQTPANADSEQAIDIVLDVVEALFQERDGNLWGSMIKQTVKRKRPNFSESFYGYRTFNQLLEDLQKRGLLEMQKDEKSGGYVVHSFGPNA